MTLPEEFTAALDGILHEDTQVGERGIDLTVREIYEIDAPGRVDFGGGELEAAARSPHDLIWRDPDDDYQWWHLDGGQYLIEYNERLTGETTALLQTRPEVAERGAFHPTLSVRRLPCIPLSVSSGGIRLKENARVSTLLPRSRS